MRVPPWVRAHPLASLAVIAALVSGLVRVGVAIMLGPRLGADSILYVSGAQQLLARGPAGLVDVDLAGAPLYPLLLALGGAIVGGDVLAGAIALNVVLGAATAGLLVRIAHRLSGSLLAAAVAGWIASVHPAFVFWGLYVLSETAFLFALALCLDRLLVLTASTRSATDTFVAGLTSVFAVLARSTAALFAAFVPVYVLVAARGDRSRMLRGIAGLAGIGIVLALLAIGTQIGRPTPLDLVARISDYVWSAIWIGLQWTEQGRATAGIDLVREPPSSAREAALAWIASDPLHFISQAARKLKVFWTPVLPEFSAFHAALNLAVYLPLYMLSVNGIRATWRRGAPLALLLAAIASFTLISMITFVDYDQRYRLPAELCLIPLAASGAAPLIVAAGRRWGRTARLFPALSPGA